MKKDVYFFDTSLGKIRKLDAKLLKYSEIKELYNEVCQKTESSKVLVPFDFSDLLINSFCKISFLDICYLRNKKIFKFYFEKIKVDNVDNNNKRKKKKINLYAPKLDFEEIYCLDRQNCEIVIYHIPKIKNIKLKNFLSVAIRRCNIDNLEIQGLREILDLFQNKIDKFNLATENKKARIFLQGNYFYQTPNFSLEQVDFAEFYDNNLGFSFIKNFLERTTISGLILLLEDDNSITNFDLKLNLDVSEILRKDEEGWIYLYGYSQDVYDGSQPTKKINLTLNIKNNFEDKLLDETKGYILIDPMRGAELESCEIEEKYQKIFRMPIKKNQVVV